MCHVAVHLFTTFVMTALDEELSKEVCLPPLNLPTIPEVSSIEEASPSPPP